MELTIFYPIITFLIFLLLVYFLYIFFGRFSPKFKDSKYKLKNYACGEDYPSGQRQQSHDLFRVAFFFTILHVGALLIATAPISQWAFLGIVLIGSMSVTALALYIGAEKYV
jgi:NADH:ubiquinone oxidoreductase subunit 3 (subunit A)